MKIAAGKMFFIVPATDYGPASLLLPLEDCFSVFQHSEKRKPALEGCFSSFQPLPHRPFHVLYVGFLTI
jgi:hypothetical protein